MSDLIIAEATLEDMDFFFYQAREEGWNPGLHDALPFYKTDPHGFFLGTLAGKKIGYISTVSYGSTFGFIGFYIVLPEYRKHGFGHQLWLHGLNYLGERAIGLDGVLKNQNDYEQSHFKLYYMNNRFELMNRKEVPSTELANIKEIPFELLLNYDKSVFGVNREVFLKQWIKMPNSYSLGKMKNGHLLGYGVLRKCYEGYKIGPLFADNAEIAEEIIQSLCIKAEGGAVFLDIPEINSEAMQLAKKLNLKSIFQTVRMYNKEPPKQYLDKVFGVTTFELG